MSAKANILKRLRAGQTPIKYDQLESERNVIAPMDDVDLLERFVQQAKALSAHVHQVTDETTAIDTILQIIGTDNTVLAWDFEHIPLAGLANSLKAKNITIADPRDGSVRVGITGAEAALAATGSLVISAKEGRPRSVSLLPHVHIAVIRAEQILPHFDTWIEQQSQNQSSFRS
ncbi:MAG: LUD domain-containing protein, partial [Chloroflexota bacterium]